ncbi:protein TOPAZ1 [Chiloscyllium plagiosum]|uniref:protein TOPAZ1 n=1 Tax=Chiloscyllium plagiosum TaxID=36176 RepID=UPI001CB862A6|nr:protein TOPAZ1 [Chiloscyllium plagiosum]
MTSPVPAPPTHGLKAPPTPVPTPLTVMHLSLAPSTHDRDPIRCRPSLVLDPAHGATPSRPAPARGVCFPLKHPLNPMVAMPSGGRSLSGRLKGKRRPRIGVTGRSSGSKAGVCLLQLRSSTIEQRMKIVLKNSTDKSPLDDSDVVTNHSIGEPIVHSTKYLNCRSISQAPFKGRTEQSKTVCVQLCDNMMPKGLKQSSIVDLCSQCNGMCTNSEKGPKFKRCQVRKQEKDHCCGDCKVTDTIKNTRRGTELIATIEPLQVSLNRNGCSKINPSEDFSKCVEQNRDKSVGMDFKTGCTLSRNNTEILLETRPSEQSTVVHRDELKALSKSHLGASTGDFEKTRTSNVTESCSEIGFKPGHLGLSWHPNGLVWQDACQDNTIWSKVGSTNVTGDDLEVEIPELRDVKTQELNAGFDPISIIVPNEKVHLSANCKRKMSECVHSEVSVAQFSCARTTPIILDTCARARPFKRAKLCQKFWFDSEWCCKQENAGELQGGTSVLKSKSGTLPCQVSLESFRNILCLLEKLSLEAPKLKAVNKGKFKNKSLLENNWSCVSFASDKVAKVHPSVHFAKHSNVEYGRQFKDAYSCNNFKSSPSINVLNNSKMANGLCVEEKKCPIRQNKLNCTSPAAHCTKVLSAKPPTLYIPLCSDTRGKVTVDYQRVECVQDKLTPKKVYIKEMNNGQSTMLSVHQNESLDLRCDQIDGQCFIALSEHTGGEGFLDDSSLVVAKKSDSHSKSVELSVWPDGNCNLEKPSNCLWQNAENTSLLENQLRIPSPKEPFIAAQIVTDSEVKEILYRSSENHYSAKRVADVIRAYEEDVLVLDVIQDDPELFGSPSNTEVVQNAEPVVALGEIAYKNVEVNSGDSYLGTQLNNKQQKESNEKISSTSLHVSEDDSSGKLPDSTTLQNDGFNTQRKTSVNEENYFVEDTTLMKEGKVTDSGYSSYQDASNTGLVSAIDEQQDDRGTEISICSFQQHCSDRHLLENQFSLEQPCSETPFHKSALTNGLRFPQEHLQPPTSARTPLPVFPNNSEHRTRARPCNYPLELTALSSGYCRFYFTTVKGCRKNGCRFGHEIKKGDEKFCMEIVQKFLDSGKMNLLLRAVRIFKSYYRSFPPGIYCSFQLMNRLLFTLLNLRMLQEVFEMLNMAVIMKVLPDGDILLNVFDLVASTDSRPMVPNLIEITCKLAEVGFKFKLDQFNYMMYLLNQLHVPHQEIDFIMALKPRLLSDQTEPEELLNLNFAVAQIEQYKEKGEWSKMGTFFQSLCWNDDSKSDLHRIATCIAITLIKNKDNGAAVPFCEFAKAVCQKPHMNGMIKQLLIRIGTSVMVAYYKSEQWRKARKVLDTLQEIPVNFTILKGLVSEYAVSRCQIINIAGDAFLRTGCVNKALRLLRESGWIISTSDWPCDDLDVLNRHNFLFSLADATLQNNMYCETLEILQNLPGFQKINGIMDISLYVNIFNNLLQECIQNNCLGVSTDTLEFMRSANIPVNTLAVRNLITALGRSCLWPKARKQYKKALSSGCYPPVEENLYRKLLPIPCFLSEVEMLLATEMFLVMNASNIQSPSVSKQSLQIVLRRNEDEKNPLTNGDYEAAVDRLLVAARISEPKLQIKHTTVNIAKEEVFSLEYSSALKWLEWNMKWAGKVWLFD